MKATRTDTRCDFGFQISDFKSASELAEQVLLRFQSFDVFGIAESAGVKIVYENWFPVTSGEFDWRSKTIIINKNAVVSFEKIIAHELGHYFLREFNVKNVTDEENFCDEFAGELLKEFHAVAQRAQS